MDLTELHRLVAAGESQTVEFKKTTAELSAACESLCAFLNGNCPGTVIIGVANGKLVGQEVSDHTQQEIANALDHIDPRIKVELSIVPVAQTRKAIALEVLSRKALIPFSFKGRSFWRTGTTTSLMPKEQYVHLLREGLERTHPFEGFFLENYSLDQLDLDAFDGVVKRGIQLQRVPSELQGKPAEALEALQLSEGGKFKNAAAILFGKTFPNLYHQCGIFMARFKGTDKSEFLDNRRFMGHAIDVFDEGMTFMQRHIPLWGKIESDSPFRKEDFLIPLEAFREAFINAICHRDYSDYSGCIYIGIYDDRMEIDNVGSLPRSLKVEDLKKNHLSIRRNPLIASAFYYLGLIEDWGRGTQKIITLCEKAKLPEPEFISNKFGFKVIFRAELKAPGPRRISGTKWSLRQREIYEIIAKCQQISLSDLESRFPDVPRRTLQRDLTALKQQRYISSIGKSQTAFWYLYSETDALSQ